MGIIIFSNMILTVFIFFTFSVVQNLKNREISQNHAIIESMNSEEIIEPFYHATHANSDDI